MVTVQNMGRVGRKTRNPTHTFQLRHEAYQIQPFMIAPVLPGETLKKAMMQSRVVVDPIKNPLIGWWVEYYWFYVKHRDIVAHEDKLQEMMLDPEADMSSLVSAANVQHFHNGGINWTKLCLDRVVETYFRAPNDVAAHTIGGMPIASINQSTWLDSVINDADFVVANDVDVDGPDSNTTIQASEIDKAMRMWEFARANGLTEMDYNDYLRTFGMRPERQEDIQEPELLRYVRNFSYPVNTVDPATGVPASAVSWAVRESLDKDRLFREPGFIVGYTVARPKVYLSRQTGSATALLSDAFAWLPAIMRDDPYTSLKKVAAGSGPLPGNTDAYWVDVKDLFIYGEQFVNFSLAATDAGLVALPTAGLDKLYPAEADVDALFKDAAGGKNLIRQDGIIDLTILGALKDTTPPVNRQFL